MPTCNFAKTNKLASASRTVRCGKDAPVTSWLVEQNKAGETRTSPMMACLDHAIEYAVTKMVNSLPRTYPKHEN